MGKNIKKILLGFIFVLLLIPFIVSAIESEPALADVIFKARVIEVLDQNNSTRDDGTSAVQQKLKLRGLSGKWIDQEIVFDGSSFDVLSAPTYQVGDKVLVNYNQDIEGQDHFYVVGFVRHAQIYWLAIIFALVVILVGRLKGFRALVVLVATFLIILKFIIPQILAGHNPLFISIIGSLFILAIAIYVTEGFSRSSTISVVAILITLLLTGLLSIWFTTLTKLTGFAGEEVIYLSSLSGGTLNLRGLLLAGIIIGALGVLDDVVVSQVALVKEIKMTDPGLTKKKVYKKAMRVGVSHISSMVNTLFLAYAGASLPLLILFSVKIPPLLSFQQIINNEMVATEIVRSLTGSIGLVLAVPLATLLAVFFLKKEKDLIS